MKNLNPAQRELLLTWACKRNGKKPPPEAQRLREMAMKTFSDHRIEELSLCCSANRYVFITARPRDPRIEDDLKLFGIYLEPLQNSTGSEGRMMTSPSHPIQDYTIGFIAERFAERQSSRGGIFTTLLVGCSSMLVLLAAVLLLAPPAPWWKSGLTALLPALLVGFLWWRFISPTWGWQNLHHTLAELKKQAPAA